jgi:hypothetical protein
VEGVVEEMSQELLERLRGAVEKVDRSLADVRSSHALAGWSQAVSNAQVRNHARNQAAQQELRAAMAIWAGPYHQAGYDDARLQRAFYHLFGLSILEAQALKASEALALLEKIARHHHAL